MAVYKWIKLSFISALCLACGSTSKPNAMSEWMKDDGKIRILATTPIVQDLVKRVGGEDVKVISVIGEDLDPHSYELVKGDGEKFAKADIIFASGLMLEHSASMQYQLHHHPHVIFLGDEVKKAHPEKIIYINGEVDPHIWMDPSTWSETIDPTCKALSSYDHNHAARYLERASNVKKLFDDLDRYAKKAAHTIPLERRYLVTSHDAFNYFVKRYFATESERVDGSWRLRMDALQGLAPDEQIGGLEIEHIVNQIVKHHIVAIFPEANLSQDALEKVKEVCMEKGQPIVLAKEPLYGDTMGGEDYLGMIKHNVDIIVRYLVG